MISVQFLPESCMGTTGVPIQSIGDSQKEESKMKKEESIFMFGWMISIQKD
jgi:hypothetical protein